jgi:hypothetical protein
MEHDPLDRWLPISLLVKEEPAFTEPAVRYQRLLCASTAIFCRCYRREQTGPCDSPRG